MEEIGIQIWLHDIYEDMSELLDKQVNEVHKSSNKPTKKVCNKNKRKKK